MEMQSLDSKLFITNPFQEYMEQTGLEGLSLFTFLLVDAETNTVIKGYENLNAISELNIDAIDLSKFSIIAEVNSSHPEASKVKSVIFSSNYGTQTENVPPYAMFGNHGNNFSGEDINIGNFELTVTAYTHKGGKGKAIGSAGLDFAVVDSSATPEPGADSAIEVPNSVTKPESVLTPKPDPTLNPKPAPIPEPESVSTASLINLALVNADTNEIVSGYEDLSGVTEIDLNDFGDLENYNVVALINPEYAEASSVKSVKFESSVGNRTENVVPFALFGDHKSNFLGKALTTGNFTIKATAYDAKNGKGSSLGTLDVGYTITDTETPGSNAVATPKLAPEPTPELMPEPIPEPMPEPMPEPAPELGAGLEPGSSLWRKAQTKDLDALEDVYNGTFDERGKPDVHVGMASSDTILLKVQQNEFINEARLGNHDFIEESFDTNLMANNIEVVLSDGTVIKPVAVHRKTKVADALKKSNKFILDHYFHIELPQELDDTENYTVRFIDNNLDDVTFTPENTVSLAIHNARVYDIDSPNKIAKLSSWISEEVGGVDYQADTAFNIVDELGQVVYSGQIALDATEDTFAGTDVYTIDFSTVTKAGTYHIEVDGIGKSLEFEIRDGVWEDMLDLSAEGLYVHRAFAELEAPYTDFTRPANTEIVFYQSSVSEADFTFFDAGKEFEVLPETADRSNPIKLSGGWFDAGDYDTKVEHISIIDSLVDLYNSNSDFYSTYKLNIPESNDNIPDVLNEAMWGMQLYKQLQQDGGENDGGVSGGFEFDSHPQGTQSWEETEAFIYAPDFFASYEFATAAAKLSTALEPYDADEAADLRERAIRAMDWAEEEYTALPDNFSSTKAEEARQHAAVEVYRLTNDDKYHDIFRSVNRRKNYDASFTYAQLDLDVYTAVDKDWQQLLADKLIERGNELVSFGDANGFDTINDPRYGQNWGFNTVMTTQHGHDIAMAHQLTGDDQYLDALANSLNFTLGVNPDNIAYTTGTVERGLAYDQPDSVLHSDGQFLDVIPDGITLYGFYENPWFAWPTINQATDNTVFDVEAKELAVPLLEAYNDYHNLVPVAEYTVHQTIEDQTFAYGYLAGQASASDTAAV
ncbi:MAG: glycoside hydrolase family 9 protein [Cyanobacteria bacterium P01_F01_bin.86]